MKVFISYSGSDATLAHLLAFILTSNGIVCLVDKHMHPSRAFDAQLRGMIDDADVVLVLLTRYSERSSWVNQEIGYAIARGKKIWPITMQKNVIPKGMIALNQTYSLFDWSDPPRTISKLIEMLKGDVMGEAGFDVSSGFDQVVTGRLQRTAFLVERLRELRREKAPLHLYCQAAFSTFAVSADPEYQQAGGHDDDLMRMMLAEREAFEDLLALPNVKLHLMLWPERPFDKAYLTMRFSNLLAWLEKMSGSDNVDITCTRYDDVNRLIVKDRFLIEGYKKGDVGPGYEASLVSDPQDKVADAIRRFEIYREQGRTTRQAAIDRIDRMFRSLTAAGS